jgi:hypothetical protein
METMPFSNKSEGNFGSCEIQTAAKFWARYAGTKSRANKSKSVARASEQPQKKTTAALEKIPINGQTLILSPLYARKIELSSKRLTLVTSQGTLLFVGHF